MLAVFFAVLVSAAIADEAAAEVLVSTLGQSQDTTVVVGGSFRNGWAQEFTVESVHDYTLTSVTIDLGAGDGVNLAIHERRDDGIPVVNPALYELTTPATTAAGSRTFTAPANATLTNGTSYLVVVTAAPFLFLVQGGRDLGFTNSSAEDDTGIAGWTVGDSSFLDEVDSPWTSETGVVRMRLDGFPHDDATLSGLALAAAGGTAVSLSPAFASGTKDYTAPVANSVSSITLTPTTNQDGATVAYLNASDAAIIDAAPATDALDAPLSVGENTFKVKVTSRDTATTETYTVVVTRAEPMITPPAGNVLVSTLEQVDDTSKGIFVGGGWGGIAQKFTVESGGDYALSSVTIDMRSAGGGVDVAIHAADGANPASTSLYALTRPSRTATGNRTFTASTRAVLTKGTSYFVVITGGPSSSPRSISLASSGGETGITGWAVDNDLLHGSSAWTTASSTVVRMRLKGVAGVAPSTDATLSGLALAHGNGDAVSLNEAFVSTTMSYTADVASAVDEITVQPTVNDGNATFEFLSGSNTALTDADPNKDDFQVSLSEGENTIKVKVTAQDTTTTATYTLVVRRNSAATGAPTISGTPQVGEVLTAVTDEIEDADGLTNVSYAYQWLHVDSFGHPVNVIGTDSATYTVQSGDVGLQIRLKVSFTDDLGHAEELISEATARVPVNRDLLPGLCLVRNADRGDARKRCRGILRSCGRHRTVPLGIRQHHRRRFHPGRHGVHRREPAVGKPPPPPDPGPGFPRRRPGRPDAEGGYARVRPERCVPRE